MKVRVRRPGLGGGELPALPAADAPPQVTAHQRVPDVVDGNSAAHCCSVPP